MDINKFSKLPIMGILRGLKPEMVAPLIEAVVSSGLKTIEITMNTASAADLIRQAHKLANGRLTIGAGTVLNLNSLNQALDSGAEFIVSPVLVPEVVESCAKKSIPVFPGALTPQEVYRAWCGGATMVKVFPAKMFGPDYFKELKGPFDDVKLLACGGVNAKNVSQFLSCGASAVAFGGSIFSDQRLKNGDFNLIEEDIKGLTQAISIIDL
ncbi:MAG: bifunctional 4-hydroxy-2-oxoglutarate aldolase/2-dehydro-3-deoxy-phosphogluconate aldolase [Candidatus Omnitrophica bacterium]|nr:bifunctional 4-hydroxy-2-oxoglutarate aldolase/2-dehydro-3-deoxy-phosphogluconate aldolase [Candidatus Omnitrophota bacterium]